MLFFLFAIASKIYSMYYLRKAISALGKTKEKNITFKKLELIYKASNDETLKAHIKKTFLSNKFSGACLILIVLTMLINWFV